MGIEALPNPGGTKSSSITRHLSVVPEFADPNTVRAEVDAIRNTSSDSLIAPEQWGRVQDQLLRVVQAMEDSGPPEESFTNNVIPLFSGAQTETESDSTEVTPETQSLADDIAAELLFGIFGIELNSRREDEPNGDQEIDQQPIAA